MSSSSSSSEKFLTLRTNDDKCFTVKQSIAVQSLMIKKMVKNDCASSPIPLSDIVSGTLAPVLEYLNKNGDAEVSEEDKQKHVEEFKKKSLEELFDILKAANHLEIEDLFQVVFQAISDNINNITLPTTSGIEDDLTPEEEEDNSQENP